MTEILIIIGQGLGDSLLRKTNTKMDKMIDDNDISTSDID